MSKNSHPARDEAGFVAVLAIIVILIGVLVAGAAIKQAVSTEGTVRRDGSSKRAVQAARAGLQSAVWLATNTAATTWTAGKCPTRNDDNNPTTLTGFDPTATSPSVWCPETTAQQLGANESVTFRLSAPYTYTVGSTTYTARDVVATGTVTKGTGSGATNSVVRRVRQRITRTVPPPSNPFALAGVISKTQISLATDSWIGDAGGTINVVAGGAISVPGNGNNSWKICGTATPGPGQSFTPDGLSAAPPCSTPSSSGGTVVTLPEVTMPATNDNATSGLASQPSSVWNPSTKALSLGPNESLTLTGNTFVFCSLKLQSRASLTFTPVTADPVRVYFDDCGAGTSITLSANSSITGSSSAYPIQAYVKGTTTITFAASVDATFGWLYAPHATVTLAANASYFGVLAAEKVTLAAGAKIKNHPMPQGSFGNNSSGVPSYDTGTFVECQSSTATSSTNPASGC